MKDQKKLKLLSFRLEHLNGIKVVELTPDILQNDLIQIKGEIGQGKSSLAKGLITSLGDNQFSKKDELAEGFIAESIIIDGEQTVYLGVKTKKNKKGEIKAETLLYSKDKDGKHYTPVIDGKKATAKDYMQMINEGIAFKRDDLFSENQKTHREFIEKMFGAELKALNIDEVLKRIKDAKENQDSKRALADANGAFKSTFKEEGYEVEDLAAISLVDIEGIRKNITSKELEKDRLVREPETNYKLVKAEKEAEKAERLNKIKDKGLEVQNSMRSITDKLNKEYNSELEKYKTTKADSEAKAEEYSKTKQTILDFPILADAEKEKYIGILDKAYSNYKVEMLPEPKKPNTITFEFGSVNIPEHPEEEYKPLIEKRKQLADEYKQLDEKPLDLPSIENVDTSEIDAEINKLEVSLKGAENTNNLVRRYGIWEDWIEAKGLYQKEIDILRKLYCKINTGVEGLEIVPKVTNTGRIEIWMMYNGSYDTKFFANSTKEMRHITGNQSYSTSQKAIIGLLLQAARLDLKPKALRLAIIDDVPLYTEAGVKILEKIQTEKDLKLITTYTSSEYDKDSIEDGTIIIEGGEVFFN